MKIFICCLLLLLTYGESLYAQRLVPTKSKEEKKLERKANKSNKSNRKEGHNATDLRWDPRKLSAKSKGHPEISSWHTGTTGIIASDAAEISLFNPTRIGFTKKTELLFRIAEQVILPNIGLKHSWWRNKRFSLASEHSLYYTYPGLKLLQKTGFKDLVPDSLKIGQGVAMRHEVLFSWLINPQVLGCLNPPAEKILSLRLGTEFYMGGDTEVVSFDYLNSLYHSQLLDGKVLYYGGLQFDSYFGNRFHYSVNSLFYSVDLKKEYAIEANLRLTYYVSQRVGLSVSGKGSYMNINNTPKFACIPLLDLTYLINPGRATIKHGLYKNKRRKRF